MIFDPWGWPSRKRPVVDVVDALLVSAGGGSVLRRATYPEGSQLLGNSSSSRLIG